ncbi:hypothetical protein SDJN02_05769, partial [Cucurbita argyrosperma subsp. argyrosperma]
MVSEEEWEQIVASKEIKAKHVIWTKLVISPSINFLCSVPALIRPIVLIHGQPNVFLEALASTMDYHLAFRNAFKHNIISASSCSSDFCVDIVTLIAASMSLLWDLKQT